jgi:hypothetical protein
VAGGRRRSMPSAALKRRRVCDASTGIRPVEMSVPRSLAVCQNGEPAVRWENMSYAMACRVVLGTLLSVAPLRAAQSRFLPSHVTLDSNETKGVVFQVSLFGTDIIRTRGQVPAGFSPRERSLNGSYDVWFAGLDGKYRVYERKGEIAEQDTVGGRRRSHEFNLGRRIELDRRGYPKTSPSNPADLIPFFPAGPVAVGDHWTAKTQVAEPLGNGNARYSYTLETISMAENRHILASLNFEITGTVSPPPALKGWTPSITGNGRLDWDTTDDQRTTESFRIVYSAVHGNSAISETEEMTERVVRIR